MKHTIHGLEVDLDPDTGKKILSEAPIRVVDVPAVPNWCGAYNRPEIQYEGEWIDLCRTDLFDDVATHLCATHTPEEWREYYLKHIILGVRIKPTSRGGILIHKDGTEEVCPPPTRRRFSCIDSTSDG